MGSCLVGIEFYFCKMRKVLETGGGDDYTTTWMYLLPLNCAPKNNYNGESYVLCILHPPPKHTHIKLSWKAGWTPSEDSLLWGERPAEHSSPTHLCNAASDEGRGVAAHGGTPDGSTHARLGGTRPKREAATGPPTSLLPLRHLLNLASAEPGHHVNHS